MASSQLKPFVFCFNPSILSTLFFHSLTHFFADGVAVFFFSCRPSDRFASFIGELQAQAGIIDPIDGSSFICCRPATDSFVVVVDPIDTALLHTASFQAQAVFIDPVDGFFSRARCLLLCRPSDRFFTGELPSST